MSKPALDGAAIPIPPLNIACALADRSHAQKHLPTPKALEARLPSPTKRQRDEAFGYVTRTAPSAAHAERAAGIEARRASLANSATSPVGNVVAHHRVDAHFQEPNTSAPSVSTNNATSRSRLPVAVAESPSLATSSSLLQPEAAHSKLGRRSENSMASDVIPEPSQRSDAGEKSEAVPTPRTAALRSLNQARDERRLSAEAGSAEGHRSHAPNVRYPNQQPSSQTDATSSSSKPATSAAANERNFKQNIDRMAENFASLAAAAKRLESARAQGSIDKSGAVSPQANRLPRKPASPSSATFERLSKPKETASTSLNRGGKKTA